MNRLSFSRQPTVWIAVVAAVIQLVDLFGVSLPDGTERAVAVLITAVGAAVTWTQVSPAKQSVRIDSAPEVQVTAVHADRQVTSVFRDGRFVSAAAEIPLYADPAEVADKSRADLAVQATVTAAKSHTNRARATKAAKAAKPAKKKGG